MSSLVATSTVAVLLMLAAVPVLAVKPTSDELATARTWTGEHLGKAEDARPYSFVYDGKQSKDLLGSWKSARTTKQLDASRSQTTQTYTDPSTGLELRCVMVEYSDYPAVEWTLYFRNTGAKDTPILEAIRSLDTRLERGAEGEFVLHGMNGDVNGPRSYYPFDAPLTPGSTQTFTPNEGKATSGAFPYYNLQMPGGGRVIVIGWPGRWESTFSRDYRTGLRVTSGQSGVHTVLRPGEEIRSPLTVMLFWQGSDTVRAQNLWRRFMVDHNLPRTADGKLPSTQLCGNNQQQIGFMAITEQNQNEFLDLYLKNGLDVDYWWIDTGWFPCGGDWWQTGTWEVDTSKFPNGIKAVSDHAHSKGKKLILWFEPERVGWTESWIAKNHPEWLIDAIWGSKLLNLADPAAAQWLTEHFDRMITEQGIDIYRQDFNIPPIDCWKSKDTPDRQGMTENLHNQAYLKFWDTLLQRHPNLRIDACASGGRRNDLETMRRAVPLHRTDHNFVPISQQSHHYSLASWLPYTGTGTMIGKSVIPPPDCPSIPQPDQFDAYFFRSAMSASLTVGVDARRTDLNYDLGHRLFEQFRKVTPFYFCDFYPLTEYSLADDVWIAWQYDRPETGEGVVEVFRRDKCNEASKTLRLCGLDPAARYSITNLDSSVSKEELGKDLMENGLSVEIVPAPGSAILTYAQIKGDR